MYVKLPSKAKMFYSIEYTLDSDLFVKVFVPQDGYIETAKGLEINFGCYKGEYSLGHISNRLEWNCDRLEDLEYLTNIARKVWNAAFKDEDKEYRSSRRLSWQDFRSAMESLKATRVMFDSRTDELETVDTLKPVHYNRYIDNYDNSHCTISTVADSEEMAQKNILAQLAQDGKVDFLQKFVVSGMPVMISNLHSSRRAEFVDWPDES